jgi:hypothetical protein
VVNGGAATDKPIGPKGEALKCESCHRPKGVLDFRKPGYSEERIKKLSGGK